ncbi:acyl-CoA dehydrogenase family protein [Aquamicrobium sp. LC103]|uniref:acyl-CoA dehydrogenase family protein n=1 Tax=Aquamicrobium sp. LC103 TaxID=1120658 RepID=UPI00069B03CC|nr:acyl-CoA dehydrogenase family protein [Aquamicrobium sp. LC103]TKT78377.1 hypothetical protein XW59_012225 [Aquamicrobium sp. LC103]
MGCDLNHGEEQRQILDAASAMLTQSFPVSRLRERRRDDLDEISVFGAFSLSLPENEGGAGFTLVEEVLLHVAFGRHVITSRVLATAVAARLARSVFDAGLARQLEEGTIAACAAVPDGDSILFIDGEDAGPAVLFDGRRLALLDRGDGRGEHLKGLGHSLALTRMPKNAVGVLGETYNDTILAVSDLLVCAQLLGIAEATRDLAVAYAQLRRQFGRPIGSFQAVKHHCANMAVAVEAASSLLDFAAVAARDARADAPFQLAALRRLATGAALGNARTCIQIHGGIGFSAEADAHHFLKHAHLLARLGGTAGMLDLPAPLAPHQTITERN